MSDCCELCVCQKEPGTFGALIAVNTITAIILVAAGAYMAWKTAAGLGWNTRPHGPEGPPEENWLSPGISILCGVMYAFKAVDWASYNDTGESTAFSLNQVWYADYLITCPLLVLDFCITVNLRYKLVFSSSIACLLAIAVATFIVDAPYRYYMYGIGLAGFICAGYALWNEINAQREKIPDSAWWYLSAGRLIFFAGWPFFPLLWTLSFHTSGVIDEEWYFILHAILDILCKAVFGFFMLGFRLELEELDFKAIEAEQAKLEGDKDAQALKNDKDAGEVLRHYNRASSGFFGQGIPDDQGSVSGGSVLMSRARRQHMLYRREASYLSMDPMAEKIRELEMLKKKIQKEVDSRSKKMQREMTARFAIQDDSDDEDGGRGRGGGSARRRKNTRHRRQDDDSEDDSDDGAAAAASSPRRKGKGRGKGRRGGGYSDEDEESLATADDVAVKVRGGATAPEYDVSADAGGRSAKRTPSGSRKGAKGRRRDVAEDSDSEDDAGAWQPGQLFPDAVRKERTLRHVYKRWQLANDKLEFYGDEIEGGQYTEEDVIKGCGYRTAAEFDAITGVLRFALKNKRSSEEIAEVLRGMRSRTLEDLREACKAAGMSSGRRGRRSRGGMPSEGKEAASGGAADGVPL